MSDMNTRILALITVLMLFPCMCRAQKWSLGTNAVDWLWLGTMNASGSVAVDRHFSVNAEARVNPWTFNSDDPSKQMQDRRQTYSAGFRWWPWYVYSGWWAGLSAQYEEYSRGGIVSRSTEEGDAYGAVLAGGYSLMLHRNLNLEFGAAFWTGRTDYTTYACPKCGRITGSGTKWFILPSSVMASLVWVF